MKQILLLFSFSITINFAFSQQTINGSLTHDGIDREYIMYIPESYDKNEPAPLVFNFHGYGSNAGQQAFYGDFRAIADTAGFILVHPEGTMYNGSTHFNVGGFTMGSTVDDVGFTAAMIEKFSTEMNIDGERIYSTGMSNGGFMSFLLACQLSDKIAAVASVTGSMTPETFNNCNPNHPTPVLQIHGTDDSVVPYEGAIWTKSVEDVVAYWVDYNNCSPTPQSTELPNTNTNDGSTVEHFVYPSGDAGATTEHYKVTGGDHTWPGSIFPLPGTNQDFNASLEIWKFFARYDINGLRTTTSTNQLNRYSNLSIFPNPTSSIINLEFNNIENVDFQLFNLTGQSVLNGIVNSNSTQIDVSHLPEGVYFLKVGNVVKKVLKVE